MKMLSFKSWRGQVASPPLIHSLDPLSSCAHELGDEEAQLVASDLPGLNPKQGFLKCFLLK